MQKKIVLIIMIWINVVILSACGKDVTNLDITSKPGKEEINKLPEDQINLEPTPKQKNETQEVVLYFADKDLMNTYRIKKEIQLRSEDQVSKAALEAWINGPDHDKLIGLSRSDIVIEYVKEVDGIAYVSFSKEIQENNLGSSGELMFTEQIAMIMQQFGFEQTQILVEGRVVEALLGHLYTGAPIAANDPESYQWIDEKKADQIVLQNEAFRIYEPAPYAKVKDRIIIRGLARVYEGTIKYEFEDGHFILDEGFTTAAEGAPAWGEFEIIINFDDVVNYSGTVILYEESAEDGSRINELYIPVNVTN